MVCPFHSPIRQSNNGENDAVVPSPSDRASITAALRARFRFGARLRPHAEKRRFVAQIIRELINGLPWLR